MKDGCVRKFLKGRYENRWSGREDLNLRPPGPETKNFELSDVFSIHVSGASTVQTHAIPAGRSHSFSYGLPGVGAPILSIEVEAEAAALSRLRTWKDRAVIFIQLSV